MIIVFGSINMDMVFRPGKLPEPGETVLCSQYEVISGGKGANQALAASRLGEKTILAGCVGDDGPAMRMLRGLRAEGVITSGVAESPDMPTGCAVVTTDAGGQNHIVVATGANSQAKADQVPDEVLRPGTVVLLQMEMTPEENWTLMARAKKGGATTILNLAPAVKIPQSVLANVDYLIVNALEARQMAEALGLSVEKDAAKLATALARQGNLTCIVTLSEKGAVCATPDGKTISVPALKLEPEQIVDTTGAGDAWCGTFAAAIHAKKPLATAMRYASAAGSLACLKAGAQESFAYLGDIESHLQKLG